MISVPLFHNWYPTEASATINNQDKWILKSEWSLHSEGYATRTAKVDGKFKTVLMHRCIFEKILGRRLERNEWVDHINGNKLDNRRRNLRLSTPAQNLRNSGLNSRNTSGYKGVSYNKASRKWIAYITLNGKTIYLGSFRTVEKAAEVRWEIAKNFGMSYFKVVKKHILKLK